MDYFEFLKKKDFNIYGEVMSLFTEDITGKSPNDTDSSIPLASWDQSPSRRRNEDNELTRRPGYAL